LFRKADAAPPAGANRPPLRARPDALELTWLKTPPPLSVAVFASALTPFSVIEAAPEPELVTTLFRPPPDPGAVLRERVTAPVGLFRVVVADPEPVTTSWLATPPPLTAVLRVAAKLNTVRAACPASVLVTPLNRPPPEAVAASRRSVTTDHE